MPPASPSTPKFSGSSTLLVVSAVGRTSLPPSTFTAAGSISCPPPTRLPECPQNQIVAVCGTQLGQLLAYASGGAGNQRSVPAFFASHDVSDVSNVSHS